MRVDPHHSVDLTHSVPFPFGDWNENNDLGAIGANLTEQVKTLLQLDRVVIYQFDPQFSGQVIAESRGDHLPALLGLHFPASDIPQHARALFLNTPHRLMVDVVACQKILVKVDGKHQALTSSTQYSAVDPCHLQYLLQMGVLSSITFSIHLQGKLWGLLVGHHSESHHYLDKHIQTVQLWVNQFAIALAQVYASQHHSQHQAQQDSLHRITNLLAQGTLTDIVWYSLLQVIGSGLSADGGYLYLRPHVLSPSHYIQTYGVQPATPLAEESIWSDLCDALSPLEAGIRPSRGGGDDSGSYILGSARQQWQHMESDHLRALFDPVDIGAVLLTPIRSSKDVIGYLCFFRCVEQTDIIWAGEHPTDLEEHAPYPRSSFSPWREASVAARPWQSQDITLIKAAGQQIYLNLLNRQVIQQLRQHSCHDRVTQLPDWQLFQRQVQLALYHSRKDGTALAVGIVKLQQLQHLNTLYGNGSSDYVLQRVADRLVDCLEKLYPQPSSGSGTAQVARWQGTNFALLMPGAGNQAYMQNNAQVILRELRSPLLLHGEPITLSSHLGLVIAPYDGQTAQELISQAEAVAQQTSQHGGETVTVFRPASCPLESTSLLSNNPPVTPLIDPNTASPDTPTKPPPSAATPRTSAGDAPPLTYSPTASNISSPLQQERLIRGLTEKIRSSLYLDDILASIVTEIRTFLKTDRVLLYQLAKDGQGCVVQESAAPQVSSMLGKRFETTCFPEHYARYYQQGRLRAVEDTDAAGLSSCHRNMLARWHVQASLMVPLVHQHSLWGILIAHHCRSSRPWRQQELVVVGQVALQAAIAIHQGEQYQRLEQHNWELRELSTQDSLTDIINRHGCDLKLAEEWQRLQRSRSPLSIILGDIDYFKQFNDTYGHPAGDRCLQEVAYLLKHSARRPGDLVARYGGEEFMVVMPETDLAGAKVVANRIQTTFSQRAIPHQQSPLGHITLSLGVACQTPSTAASLQTLIQTADRNLYRAKSNGRNQIR